MTDPDMPELGGGFHKDLLGYCTPWSVRPGESVNFKLSRYAEGEVSGCVVRLISGDDRPHGTGLLETVVDGNLRGLHDIPCQALVPGSYARVDNLPPVASGEVDLWCYPTLPQSNRQTLWRNGDVRLCVSETGFYAEWAAGDVMLLLPVQAQRWYRVTFSFGALVTLRAQLKPRSIAETARLAEVDAPGPCELPGGTFYLAASEPGAGHFFGRLEAPRISSAAVDKGTGSQAVSRRSIAAWDFSRRISTQTIEDVSGNGHHGRLYQTPTRGVCGVAWDGTVQNYQDQPAHYGAIHFHADDLTDACWQDTLRWQVPEDLPSGQYALKLEINTDRDNASDEYVPFFVRPPRGRAGARLVYLVPTASYLAYANQRLGLTAGPFGDPRLRHANDAFLKAHEDVGFSMYEYHGDQSGVHFSSRLRPILNMKPRNGTWAFNADTHITAWLDAVNEPFDVLTDEDLHLEGAAALAPYRTVITGTHPEYYSTAMREGLSQWLGDGGRLMYMGGNGFYWRVAFQPDNPAIMEVRRAEDGTRAWIARPGEYYQQFNGEYGGMWRRLGAPPNELVGVGFAAQGFDGGTYYRPGPGALDPRAAFILEGVSDAEVWGDYGNQGGGAAGEELDRWDPALGSPAHALVLASSENHKPGMLRVKEEFHMMEYPGDDPKVRADMVFYEMPGGGAVFSTGSISFAGSLAHNNYHNDIAQITLNVLRRFLDETPFELPAQELGR